MRSAASLLALALAGCSSFSAQPIATPAPTDVAAEIASLATISVDPVTYLNAGVALVNMNCNSYFNSLVMTANNTKLGSDLAILSGAAASALLAATGSTGAGVAIPGILGPLIGQGSQDYANAQTGGINPAVAAALVGKAQTAYLGALAVPTSVAEAQMDVTAYAAICQPPQITAFGLQAALNANAQTTVSQARLLAAPAPVPAVGPVIHNPPVVHF